MIKKPEVEQERVAASKWTKAHRAKDKYDADPAPDTAEASDAPAEDAASTPSDQASELSGL